MTDKPAEPKTPSRQDTKRFVNLATAHLNVLTDKRQRLLEQMKENLEYERSQKMNAMALLEACVRRYGPLAFDRAMVQQICARGRVRVTVEPHNIKVSLLDTPEVVATSTIVDATPDAS